MYGDGSRSHLTSDGKPLPVVTALNRQFWALARDGVFSIQTCRACGHRHIPESPTCPQCLGDDQVWEPAKGTGTLESWVEFHRAYWDGFKTDLPYQVGLIRLEEGPLFVCTLAGDPSGFRVGAPVRVTFRQVADDIALPVFALA